MSRKSPQDRSSPSTVLTGLSIARIRERWIDSGEPIDPDTLRVLSRDPRKGVRRLAQTLIRRQEQHEREQRRLDRLLTLEDKYRRLGRERIAGVDEVGAGPLAGPVVAGAVILPAKVRIERVDDSKHLDTQTRSELDVEIRNRALCYSIGEASVEEIDRLNIRQATLLAMRRALEGLATEPDQVLVDARTVENLPWPQEAIIRGDSLVHCISCASILAKVYRDQLMTDYDRLYPGYHFARHKGYGTPDHLLALRTLGPSPIHRESFHWPGKELPLFPNSMHTGDIT